MLKKILVTAAILVSGLAQSQVVPPNTLMGNSTAVPAPPAAIPAHQAAGLSGYINFAIPAVTDSAPIIQALQLGETVGAFTGNYYSDPVMGFGYNACYKGNTITAPCVSTDPWSQDIEMEADYAHQALPATTIGNSTGTATAGTSSTVLYDTAQTLTINALRDQTLYDVTQAKSSQITANTATTITVSPEITGMTVGDTYKILRRDSENRWEAFVNGGRYPVYQWNADKGTSESYGALHLFNNAIAVPTDPCFGLEFIPDVLANTAGSGNSDIATLSACAGMGAKFALKGYVHGLNTIVAIGEGQTGGSNALINMYAGQGTTNYESSSITSTMASATASRILWQMFNSGTTPKSLIDATYGGVATLGGASFTALSLVGATIKLTGVTTGTNADFLCLSSGGVILVQTSACTISSRRFKEEVVDMQGSAMPELSKMEVASFRLKDTHNKDPNAHAKQIGLIAENIAEVAPECAIYENDMTTPKSYRQECVIALLVKAVQEQQHEIESLKRRL
jgi:hypothetical protein